MDTDLASVPSPLWGLIAPFGRQSRAALIHDHGCDEAEARKHNDPKGAYTDRRRIDYIFRNALEESDVSKFRAWLMWEGVSLARYFGFRLFRGVAIGTVLVAWWAVVVVSVLGFSPLARPSWITSLAGLAAAATVSIIAARSDWNLMAFGLAAFPLVTLILVAFVVDLVVQAPIYAVSWLTRLVFGGADPVFKPTARKII